MKSLKLSLLLSLIFGSQPVFSFSGVGEAYRETIKEMVAERKRMPKLAGLCQVVSMYSVPCSVGLGLISIRCLSRCEFGDSLGFLFATGACYLPVLIAVSRHKSWANKIVETFEGKAQEIAGYLRSATEEECMSVLNAELEIVSAVGSSRSLGNFFVPRMTFFFGLSKEREERIHKAFAMVRQATMSRLEELREVE